METPRVFFLRRYLFLFVLPSRRRLGCDWWWLHWDYLRVKSFNQRVMFYRDFFFIYDPSSLYLLFCPYLCINFAMPLCLVCVCLSITFELEIFLFYAHMAPTPLPTRWDISPYTRVYESHKEWRSICGHVGSPTCLITVKPHLEFSSFSDALSLIVPIATMYYLRGWYL